MHGNVTRKEFIAGGAVLGAAAAMRLNAGVRTSAAFRPEDYAEFRRGLRAFYPDECHGKCKDPRQVASVKAIGDELDAFIAANPGYDVLDVRRELYLSMRRHFIPYILPGSPFYFEAGVNGGWCVWRGAESVPGQHARRVCFRFLRDRHLIPQEAWDVQLARGRERFLNVAFGDDTHHIPPFKTIFTKGFCGVRQEVAAALAKCPADDPRGRKMLETALVGLDTVHFIQLRFADEARRQMAAEGLSAEDRRRLQRIADSAMRCPWEPPRTFYEGLNSLWFIREILGYVDGTMNFSLGRPDAWLDGFLKADLAAGRITMSEVRDLVAKFLVTADCHLDDRLEINAYSDQEAEIPLTLGGCDAEGRQVYNDITEMALDAHLDLGLVFPKLHCRISAKSPQPYLEKIGEMLMRGHAVFALFNDDRHVPNFMALGYPVDRARDYLGCGCWDGNVDSETCVDTANYMSVLRMLELTIYRDPETERAARVRVDPIDGARSFEEVRDTLYRNFIRFLRDTLSTYTRYGRAFAEVNAKPVYSACLSGCIESRCDALEGGARFSPRIITLAFLANVVDSLCSIRKICFEDHAATLPEFLAAVRSNWKGPRGEELRLLAMSAPYWGDNSEASNGLMRFWIDSVSRDIEGMTTDKGGPYVLACWIYREFILWGEKTRATPDGRHDGDRLAQGFSPSEFRCKAGATTVFNAIGAIDHSRLYASNANLSFDKLSMTAPVFAAIFRVACRKGMHLLQPNCNSVEDLIDAQKHPERHQDLIVKVCGYSARFISLSKRYQDEVIARHRLK